MEGVGKESEVCAVEEREGRDDPLRQHCVGLATARNAQARELTQELSK